MSRQPIRSSVSLPKATFTQFQKGMETSSHAKESYNPRSKLIENFEISADGKLQTRRPVVPHKLNQSNYDVMYMAQPNTKVIKVVHAPFAKLQVPFVWVVAVLDPTSKERTDVQLQYYTNGSSDISIVADPEGVLGNVDWNETGEIDYIFKESLDFLIMTARGGVVIVKDISRSASEIILQASLPEDYLPTTSELSEQGLNLYLDNPFFINNNITGGEYALVTGIDTYKINGDDYRVDSTVWKFKPNPLETDLLALKARLNISNEQIIRELNTFYFPDGHPRFDFAWCINNSYVANSNGDFVTKEYTYNPVTKVYTSSEKSYSSINEKGSWYATVASVSPYIQWKRATKDSSKEWKDIDANEKTFPINSFVQPPAAVKYQELMPLITTFLGDQPGMAAVSNIGKTLFGDDSWEFEEAGWGLFSSTSWRQDIRVLPAGTPDSYKWQVVLVWAEPSFAIFAEKELNTGELADKTGTDKDGYGIVIGDPNVNVWASYYENKYDNTNQFKDFTVSSLVEALDPYTDYSIVLSDFYAPRSKTKDGFHRIKFNFKNPVKMNAISFYTPIPHGGNITMRDFGVKNFDTNTSSAMFVGSHAVFKGGH